MTRKNNQAKNKAIKSQSRNADARKLDNIQKNSTLNWLGDETIFDNKFSTPNHIRRPDLLCKGKIEVILEHDTYKIHGELSEPNERTLKRNLDYAISNRPFVILHEDLARLLKLDESKLATYLYWHEIMRVKTFEMVKEELMY